MNNEPRALTFAIGNEIVSVTAEDVQRALREFEGLDTEFIRWESLVRLENRTNAERAEIGRLLSVPKKSMNRKKAARLRFLRNEHEIAEIERRLDAPRNRFQRRIDELWALLLGRSLVAATMIKLNVPGEVAEAIAPHLDRLRLAILTGRPATEVHQVTLDALNVTLWRCDNGNVADQTDVVTRDVARCGELVTTIGDLVVQLSGRDGNSPCEIAELKELIALDILPDEGNHHGGLDAFRSEELNSVLSAEDARAHASAKDVEASRKFVERARAKAEKGGIK